MPSSSRTNWYMGLVFVLCKQLEPASLLTHCTENPCGCIRSECRETPRASLTSRKRASIKIEIRTPKWVSFRFPCKNKDLNPKTGVLSASTHPRSGRPLQTSPKTHESTRTSPSWPFWRTSSGEFRQSLGCISLQETGSDLSKRPRYWSLCCEVVSCLPGFLRTVALMLRVSFLGDPQNG